MICASIEVEVEIEVEGQGGAGEVRAWEGRAWEGRGGARVMVTVSAVLDGEIVEQRIRGEIMVQHCRACGDIMEQCTGRAET